jgi:hypothetical protein
MRASPMPPGLSQAGKGEDFVGTDVFGAGALGEEGADPAASATRVVAPKLAVPRGSSFAAPTGARCDTASMAGDPDAASESETAPAVDECVTFFRAEINPPAASPRINKAATRPTGAPHEDLPRMALRCTRLSTAV